MALYSDIKERKKKKKSSVLLKFQNFAYVFLNVNISQNNDVRL